MDMVLKYEFPLATKPKLTIFSIKVTDGQGQNVIDPGVIWKGFIILVILCQIWSLYLMRFKS